MADTSKRTLEIRATFQDFATSALRRMGQGFATVVRGTMLGTIATLKVAMLGLKVAFLGAISGIVAVFGLLRGAAGIGAVAEEAANLSKVAKSLGVSAGEVQVLGAAFGYFNVQAQETNAILRQLQKDVGAALLSPTSNAARAFKALGIGLDELRGASPEELFAKMAKGIEQYSSEADRATIVSILFPEKFQEVLSVLGEGEKSFRAITERARDFGGAMSDEAAKAGTAFFEAFRDLQLAIDDVRRSGILRLLADLKPLVALVTDFVRTHKGELVLLVQIAGRLIVSLGIAVVRFVVFLLDNLPNLLAGIGALVSGLGELADILAKLAPSMSSVGDALKEAGQSIRNAGAAFGLAPDAAQPFIKAMEEAAQKVRDADAALEAYHETQRRGVEAASSPDSDVATREIERLGGVLKVVDAFDEKTGEVKFRLIEGEKAIRDYWRGNMQNFEQQLEADARAALERLSALQIEVDRIKAGKPAQGTPQNPVGDGAAPGGLGIEATRALQGSAGGFGELRKFLADLQAQLASAPIAFDRATEAASRFSREVGKIGAETTDEFFGPFGQGVKQALDGWNDMTSAARQAAVDILHGGFDAVADGFTAWATGAKKAKEAFRDMAVAVLQELARILIRLALVRLLSALIPGIGGAAAAAPTLSGLIPGGGGGTTQQAQGGVVLGGLKHFRAFAAGGVVNRPTLGLFGEAGAEAFVPLASGKIPVRVMGQQQQPTNVVELHVHSADSADVRRWLASEGEFVAKMVTHKLSRSQEGRTALRRAVS